jgi:branched-chain amino acid transport system substrate-binding protein
VAPAQLGPWEEGELVRIKLGLALVASLSLFVAACGGDDDNGGGGSNTVKETVAASDCGPKAGQQATGSPIKLGALATKQPGTDFSEIPRMTQAYFKCVNANGGVNGHPVNLVIEYEQTDPGQAAQQAKKLIQSEKVLGIAGSSSIIEGDVNHTYYEQQGYNVIAAGIAPSAYATSNIASVNMGPRYSSDGATQALIRKGVKKIVLVQSNVPGTAYIQQGPELITKDAGLPFEGLKENVPIQDANSAALKAVQAAGDGGGVVLNFTPPEALKILQAAQQQGLQDRVKWGCSTPCNTDFLAKALGDAWDGKLFVNAELNLITADAPDSNLYRKVRNTYAKDIPLGSFSQMGFIMGRIATEALQGVKGDYTKESVNKAFLDVKDFKTDILCGPWYYGKAPLHIPNNIDRTVTPKGGTMVQNEDCFPISDVDPAIKQVRDIEQKDPSLIGK